MNVVNVFIWCTIGAFIGVASANWQSDVQALGRRERRREFALQMLLGAVGALLGVHIAAWVVANTFSGQNLTATTMSGLVAALSASIGALVLIAITQAVRSLMRAIENN